MRIDQLDPTPESLDSRDFEGAAYIYLIPEHLQRLAENVNTFTSLAGSDVLGHFKNGRLHLDLIIENVSFSAAENNMLVPGIGDIMFHYFHGKAPLMLRVDGVLFDRGSSEDYPLKKGKPQLMEVYRHVLRASMVAKTGIIPNIFFKGAVAQGAFHNMALSETSQNTDIVRFSTQIFVFDLDLFSTDVPLPVGEIPETPAPPAPEPEPSPEPEPITEKDSIRATLVDLAQNYVNHDIPYVPGGATPDDGFDCSGFTQYLYKEVDISVPKHSSKQLSSGKEIAFSDIQPGDLLFFDTSAKDPVTPPLNMNHVVIYMGGNQIAHSSSGKNNTVVVPISTWWENRFVAARTYI